MCELGDVPQTTYESATGCTGNEAAGYGVCTFESGVVIGR